jgi:hypothetical protein
MRRYADAIRAKCLSLGCTVEDVKPGKHGVTEYRVVMPSPDGWWFKIAYDPWCVEIQTKPSTLDEWRARKDLIDDLIFKTAKGGGFITQESSLSGHLNIGFRSAFQGKAERFLRFFVDYANHPELALGVLGRDVYNGPPLSVLRQSQREALSAIVERFHRGTFRSVPQIARAIVDQVYTHTYKPEWNAGAGRMHYQAMGIDKILSEGGDGGDVPFELRAMRNQTSAEDFILQGELQELRVAYLEKERPLLRYLELEDKSPSPEQQASRFYVYVVEADGDWGKFSKLLPKEARGLDDFVRGEVSWRSPKFTRALRYHLPHFATSRWVRERVISALKREHATGDNGMAAMSRIIAQYRGARTDEERKIYEEALRDVLAAPEWSAPQAIGRYQRQAAKRGWDFEPARALFAAEWSSRLGWSPPPVVASCWAPWKALAALARRVTGN